MQEICKNHLYIFNTNLNLEEIKKSCFKSESFILANQIPNETIFRNRSNLKPPKTTELYASYNLLTINEIGFNYLYHSIKNSFYEIKDSKDQYYIRSWLNMYRNQNGLAWHSHLPDCKNSWHGYFCVNAEPSITEYRVLGKEISVNNKNNSIVIGKCQDNHKTVVWDSDENPRITIVFDIISHKDLEQFGFRINHWIPI